jgi:hypothetical protein
VRDLGLVIWDLGFGIWDLGFVFFVAGCRLQVNKNEH